MRFKDDNIVPECCKSCPNYKPGQLMYCFCTRPTQESGYKI